MVKCFCYWDPSHVLFGELKSCWKFRSIWWFLQWNLLCQVIFKPKISFQVKSKLWNIVNKMFSFNIICFVKKQKHILHNHTPVNMCIQGSYKLHPLLLCFITLTAHLIFYKHSVQSAILQIYLVITRKLVLLVACTNIFPLRSL